VFALLETARGLAGTGTKLADRYLSVRVNGDLALFCKGESLIGLNWRTGAQWSFPVDESWKVRNIQHLFVGDTVAIMSRDERSSLVLLEAATGKLIRNLVGRFDPDVWILEIEDRAGRHFLERIVA